MAHETTNQIYIYYRYSHGIPKKSTKFEPSIGDSPAWLFLVQGRGAFSVVRYARTIQKARW